MEMNLGEKSLVVLLFEDLKNGENICQQQKLRLAAEEDQVDKIRQREEENERKRQLLAKNRIPNFGKKAYFK